MTPPLRELAGAMRGQVLLPSSSADLVYNERFTGRRPLAVARPVDDRDVQAAVRWAQRRGVTLTVRSGGHSYEGYSTSDGGLVLDLRSMSDVTVGNGRVRVGAGAQLIDVHATLARAGGALPTGSCPMVGVGGMTQGGGMGLSGRALGLTCDRVRALTIVTPDGRVRRCDSQREADVFWACRGGGGGNFGVVTSFELAPAPARAGAYVSMSWPWDRADEGLDAWQRLAPQAADELTTLLILTPPHGMMRGPGITMVGQYLGTEIELLAAVDGLRRAGGTVETIGSRSSFGLVKHWTTCTDLRSCHTAGLSPDGTGPRAGFDAASAYVDRPLDAGGRAALLRAVSDGDPTAGVLLLDCYGGAINRVPPDATAFAHRSALYCMQIYAPVGAAGFEAANRWKRRVAGELRPHGSGEAYQNYIDRDQPRWEEAYYGTNLARLREIKAAVDPDGLLRFPQGIRPAGS